MFGSLVQDLALYTAEWNLPDTIHFQHAQFFRRLTESPHLFSVLHELVPVRQEAALRIHRDTLPPWPVMEVRTIIHEDILILESLGYTTPKSSKYIQTQNNTELFQISPNNKLRKTMLIGG